MLRRWILVPAISIAVLVPTALAQVPRQASELRWHTFVAGQNRSSERVPVTDEPGRIDLGDSPWSCGYARTRYAGVGTSEWSVQRVLACRRGPATVSSTSWCRVAGGHLQDHAATLSLGTVGQTDHVTVTLSCDPQGR
ncbi:MAG: hypothetical protein H6719_27275 [Sandaracinaceae bacterium]|nr:hypothetical protein [Sandaracinaceae bacterium]